MLVKRLEARTHLSSTVYELQRDIGRKLQLFRTPLHLTPPYGVAPRTIAVNVIRLERGFNACKTPRCIIPIYLQPFPSNSSLNFKSSSFQHIFAHFGLPYVRLWTIAVNVTWIEREFNAGQTHRSTYTSTFKFQPFTSYSEILVGKGNLFLPLPCI